MFIFQSTVALALHQGMRPKFARSELRMVNTTFDLKGISHLFTVEDSFDKELPLMCNEPPRCNPAASPSGPGPCGADPKQRRTSGPGR